MKMIGLLRDFGVCGRVGKNPQFDPRRRVASGAADACRNAGRPAAEGGVGGPLVKFSNLGLRVSGWLLSLLLSPQRLRIA